MRREGGREGWREGGKGIGEEERVWWHMSRFASK